MTDSTQHALEQGSYDLIKRRLNNFGATLKTQTDNVNSQRISEFGSTELQVKGRVRARAGGAHTTGQQSEVATPHR